MQNLINWFEIPVSDLNRAKTFYQGVLNVEINEVDMHGTKMGFFPSDGKGVSGALVQGDGYETSSSGSLVYLNGGKDLNNSLKHVGRLGGKVIVEKTQITPEMGYFALFMDSEGNKVALHSIN